MAPLYTDIRKKFVPRASNSSVARVVTVVKYFRSTHHNPINVIKVEIATIILNHLLGLKYVSLLRNS